MRLADVVWAYEGEHPVAIVRDRQGVSWVFSGPSKNFDPNSHFKYVAIQRYNKENTFQANTELEANCWLADKEPAK